MLGCMQAVVSLLRAVNVGGRNRVDMKSLRDLYASLGLQQTQTYVQSGNVISLVKQHHGVALTRRIEDAIEERFGFRPKVILRTSAELKEVVANNPFTGRRDIEPGKLLVTFLAGSPDAETQQKLLSVGRDGEELRMGGDALSGSASQPSPRPTKTRANRPAQAE